MSKIGYLILDLQIYWSYRPFWPINSLLIISFPFLRIPHSELVIQMKSGMKIEPRGVNYRENWGKDDDILLLIEWMALFPEFLALGFFLVPK